MTNSLKSWIKRFFSKAHLIVLFEHVKNIVWQTWKQIDDKPRLKVIASDGRCFDYHLKSHCQRCTKLLLFKIFWSHQFFDRFDYSTYAVIKQLFPVERNRLFLTDSWLYVTKINQSKAFKNEFCTLLFTINGVMGRSLLTFVASFAQHWFHVIF